MVLKIVQTQHDATEKSFLIPHLAMKKWKKVRELRTNLIRKSYDFISLRVEIPIFVTYVRNAEKYKKQRFMASTTLSSVMVNP